MKQTLFLSCILVFITACTYTTGSGNIVVEKKQVPDFTSLSAGSAFTVEVKIGSPISVEVETDDNLMQLVTAKVVDNTLRLHVKNGVKVTNGQFNAYVTVPSLDNIESSGAANVKVLGELKNSKLIKLDASGAATITAQVDAPRVELESSGAGTLHVSGNTKEVKADASGAAKIFAGELLSERADADASGAGNVHVFASVKLKAHASGAGNVFYKGGAADVAVDKSGAGNVKKED